MTGLAASGKPPKGLLQQQVSDQAAPVGQRDTRAFSLVFVV
jgi:hypothetical protein